MMYCTNCQKERSGKFCEECGTILIEKPILNDLPSISLGDANAISGGLNINASKNIHNVDNSIKNTTTTINNITKVVAQRTDPELLQDRKKLFSDACRRAYEDNVLEQNEKLELDRYRIELGLDETTADKLLEEVQKLVNRNAQKTELTGLAKIKLRQFIESIQRNDVDALEYQIGSIEALVKRFSDEELQSKYYLVLAAIKEDVCIEKYRSSLVDNYWQSYWACLAYQKKGQTYEAEEMLFSLECKFPNYPIDNIALLAAACALMRHERAEALEILQTICGEYSQDLHLFAGAIYLLLEEELAQEMGATTQGSAFYLINFFNRDFVADKAKECAKMETKEKVETENESIVETKNKCFDNKSDIKLKTEKPAHPKSDGTAITRYTCQPKTRKELRAIIVARLRKDRNANLNDIDISKVTDMTGLFKGLSSIGNIDISEWDVGHVKNMYIMFKEASFSGDISKWNVSNVINMREMFAYSKFNGDISRWDVSNVRNMREMFRRSEFNQDISDWDVSKVEIMAEMFCASAFNGDISKWDVSKVKDMEGMFYDSAFNGDISRWDVSKVESMSHMFSSAFTGDISNWDVSSVKDMSYMFLLSKSLIGDISNWDVSNVENMKGMFKYSNFSQDISNWKINRNCCTDDMFNGCKIYPKYKPNGVK